MASNDDLSSYTARFYNMPDHQDYLPTDPPSMDTDDSTVTDDSNPPQTPSDTTEINWEAPVWFTEAVEPTRWDSDELDDTVSTTESSLSIADNTGSAQSLQARVNELDHEFQLAHVPSSARSTSPGDVLPDDTPTGDVDVSSPFLARRFCSY